MGTLKASAAEVDLSPRVGIWMSGFAARIEPSTGIHDPIMARALLLNDGHATLAIVSCDLLGLTPLAAARVRDRIALATDGAIPARSILIACTHTHSGPASMPMRGVMGYVDGPWLRDALRKIVELVAGLLPLLRPARLAHGEAIVAEIGFNRQDGSQPVDESLDVFAVNADDGAGIATCASYATHPVVLGPSNRKLSGDFPGEVARALAAARGGVGFFLQGACGDVDPIVYRDRGWGAGSFEDARQVGERLAGEAVAALAPAVWTSTLTLRSATKTLPVPLDPAPSLAELQEMSAGFEADRRKALSQPDGRADVLVAEAMLDWTAELERAVRADLVPRFLPAELFVAAVGDVRIIGIPFEVYSGIGTAIRAGMRPGQVVVAGYANGLYGYCPTRKAKDQGGYGPVSSSRWFPQLLTPVGHGADELIVSEACTWELKGAAT